jgi:PAS domain S-box-containing protein
MESADRAFDSDARTKWLAFSHPGSAKGSWIQWQLVPRVDDLPVINLLRLNRLLAEPTPAMATSSNPAPEVAGPVRTLTGYALTSANDYPARDPRDWRLQGSRDEGRSWDTLDTRRNEFFARRLKRRAFALPKPVTYPLYRLCIDCVARPGTNSGSANSVQLAELEPLYSSRDAKAKLSVVVSAQGENGPRETAAMAFDGDPATKWLDISNADPNRASWIQWSYSAMETEPVIRQDLVRSLRSRPALVTRVQFAGVLVSVDASSKRVGFLDETGFEVFELDAPLAGVAPGDRVRLSGRLQFDRDRPRVVESQLISLGRLASGPDLKKEKPFPERQDFYMGTLEGRVVSVSQDDQYLTAEVVPAKGSGSVQVNILNSRQTVSDWLTNSLIHAQGVVEPIFDGQGQRVAGLMWVASSSNLTVKTAPDAPRQRATPPETPARADEKNPVSQMHRIYELAHGQSTNGIPIKVRGVITYVDLGLSDFYLQSGSDSLLIHDQMSAGLSPFLHQEGSYVELRATAYAGTPPDIYPSGFATVLGKGRMPEPLRHSWDYLMTGKDDGRWIEVEGVVAGAEEQRLMLTTHGGQLIAWVNELDKTFENRLLGSHVRAAGVCSPVLNQRDQRLGLRLLVPSSRNIQIVEAAPDNPFNLPSLAVSNVMRLDPQDAGPATQLVKTTGVITHKGPQSFFLQDGADGIRVFPRQDGGFDAGDRVEAVGLAEPDGLSPRLVQALVRKIGIAPLPPCTPIAFPGINTGSTDAGQDATRGQLDATLLGSSLRDSFQVLELRADKTEKVFHALLPITGGSMPALAPGSRLRLQGVYKAVTDTVPDFGQVVSSFEMYLNTPADIKVLARPPWWSTRRTVWILGGVGGVLLVSLAWVGSLRRQVRQRTRQLHDEIVERKRAEEAQLESQALYHSLVEHMPAGLYRMDSEGRYVFANSWFCGLKGLSLEKLLGKTPAELALASGAQPNGSPENLREHELIMQTGQLTEREEELLDAEGQMRCLHVVKSPVITTGGWIIGSQGMLFDITGRKQAEARLGEAHRELLQASRMAGMAEVATSVLHNVGNVLNSVNISSSVIGKKLKQSRVANLGKLAMLLEEQAGDLPGYFATHPKAKELPRYLSALAVHLATEQEQLLQEVASLTRNIDHIKEIVAMQQNYARVSGVLEWLPVPDMVEDALRLNAGAMQRHQVHVIRDYAEMPPVMADKHKVLQILVNLIRNAKYALDEAAPTEKRLILQTRTNNGNVQISVIDNGIGIPPENLTRIFGHGFTTRKNGHGFGLHSGALAAREMGGSLTVHSDGSLQGAVFTLEFPCQPNASADGANPG